jgi:hypothetical protein
MSEELPDECCAKCRFYDRDDYDVIDGDHAARRTLESRGAT